MEPLRADAEPSRQIGCLLSVIIPTYNRRACIGEAIGSVLDQHVPSVEVVVVDDGSEDGTGILVRAEFPQVRVVRSPANLGPGPARNLGLDAARGSFFLPLDSDCRLLPGTLAFLVDLLAREPGPFFVFPCRSWPGLRRATRLEGDGQVTAEDLLLRRVGELVPVVCMAALNGLRYPDFRCGGERLLWVELAQRHPPRFVDRLLLEYRTDVPNRISSAEYQLAHAAEIARVLEAVVERVRRVDTPEGRRLLARRLLGLGSYHVLAGNGSRGRACLQEAQRLGNRLAVLAWMASFFPVGLRRWAFRLTRALQAWFTGNLSRRP